MIGGQSREVDLDLLADYVGGALDGTPDAAEIALLIAEDPAWAAAHVAMAEATEAVRGSLANWAAEPIQMPADVVDRLTEAIAMAPVSAPFAPAGPLAAPGSDPPSDPPSETPSSTRPGSLTRGGSTPAGKTPPADRTGRRLTAVPAQPGPSPRRDRVGGPARRRRWSRLAGPIAVAAAVVGFAGLAVNQLVTSSGGDDASTASEQSAGDAAPAAPGASGSPRAVLRSSAERLATGLDYSPETVPDAAARVFGERFSPTDGPPADGRTGNRTPGRTGGVTTDAETRIPSPTENSDDEPFVASGLARLSDQAALARCLDAVAGAHARGPVTVDLVDYASFRGTAALIVVFTDVSGARWASVSGPDCGTPGAGADIEYRTRVG